MYLWVRLVQDRIHIKMGLHEAGIEATLHPRVLRSEDGGHTYIPACVWRAASSLSLTIVSSVPLRCS